MTLYPSLLLLGLLATQIGDADRVLSWNARIDAAHPESSARTYRLFEPAPEIALGFRIANDSDDSIVLNVSRLSRDVTVSGAGGQGIATISTPGVTRGLTDGLEIPFTEGDLTVRLASQEGVESFLQIRRADGRPFEFGDYDLDVTLGNVTNAARTESGGPWAARALRMTTIKLRIAPPITETDLMRQRTIAGQQAMNEGALDEAIRAFAAAVAADPTNAEGLAYLGRAYLYAHRYRDAVDVYSRALSLARGERSTIPMCLALAYLGLSDERSAMTVLRQSGVAEKRLPAAVADLRAQLARLRPPTHK